jgi:hypothetical protein
LRRNVNESLRQLTVKFILFNSEHEALFLVNKSKWEGVFFAEGAAELIYVSDIFFVSFSSNIQKAIAVGL